MTREWIAAGMSMVLSVTQVKGDKENGSKRAARATGGGWQEPSRRLLAWCGAKEWQRTQQSVDDGRLAMTEWNDSGCGLGGLLCLTPGQVSAMQQQQQQQQ
ncbi:hypothetical protein CKAH01_04037 [Colletotrichum kahawae]|uniref:Uncharacterized protein n=1 Tax=Colletotrichum kahawae TaxID=34407 RepID=A0AAD9YR71_COLKA|nr:hypothetical protein CKAH01_04037 [Colletotrichum kahawae]